MAKLKGGTTIGGYLATHVGNLSATITGQVIDGDITATTFIGDLTGDVTGNVSGSSGSCTGNAATASQLYINDDDTGDTNCPILFTANTTAGYKAVYEDSAVYIDNTNNNIHATGFTGALTGNASSATYASAVTVANEASDTSCYVSFYTTTSGNLPGKTNTKFTFNANTAALGVGVGSAAAPGYSFTDDTNTGLYRTVGGSAEDLLGITTAGVARATFSSTEIDLTSSTIDLNASSIFTMDSVGNATLTSSGGNMSLSARSAAYYILMGENIVSTLDGIAIAAAKDNDGFPVICGMEVENTHASLGSTAYMSFSAKAAFQGHALISLTSEHGIEIDYNTDADMVSGISHFLIKRDGVTKCTFGDLGGVSFTVDSFHVVTAGTVPTLNMTSASTMTLSSAGLNTLKSTGTGDVLIDSAMDLGLIYENGASGSGVFTIKYDATTIGTFSASGGIAWTPNTNQTFSVASTGTGYTLIDGVYYVNGANSTAFATLLGSISADAHIVLGPGTHDISWTTAQTHSYDLKIVGSGASQTFIRFTSSDADCCLNFTNVVQIYDVAFSTSTTMTNQTYAVQLAAFGSVIRDCRFQVNPTGNALNITSGSCVIDNVSFISTFPTEWLIYITGTDSVISKCKSIDATCVSNTSGSVYMSSTATNTKMSDCKFTCASGSTYSTNLKCEANDCRFVNIEIYAGELGSTGHYPRCVTVTGNNAYFDNCIFQAGWDTSTNCADRVAYVNGASCHFSNCYFYQRMMDYTLAGNPTDGMIYLASTYTRFSNCRIVANKSKCCVYISAGADYTAITGSYVGGTASNNGSYLPSAAIWGVSGAHYCSVVGNLLRSDGDTGGYCVSGSAVRGCSAWTINDNICYKSTGNAKGIDVEFCAYSCITGNVASGSTLRGATDGTNAYNVYGTGNANESTGNNY